MGGLGGAGRVQHCHKVEGCNDLSPCMACLHCDFLCRVTPNSAPPLCAPSPAVLTAQANKVAAGAMPTPSFSPKRALARASGTGKADQPDCTLVPKGTLLYQINGEPPVFTAGHAFWTWCVHCSAAAPL